MDKWKIDKNRWTNEHGGTLHFINIIASYKIQDNAPIGILSFFAFYIALTEYLTRWLGSSMIPGTFASIRLITSMGLIPRNTSYSIALMVVVIYQIAHPFVSWWVHDRCHGMAKERRRLEGTGGIQRRGWHARVRDARHTQVRGFPER